MTAYCSLTLTVSRLLARELWTISLIIDRKRFLFLQLIALTSQI